MSEIVDNYVELAESRDWDADTMARYIENECNDPKLAAAYRAQVGAPAPAAAEPAPDPQDAALSEPSHDAALSDPSQVTASGSGEPAGSEDPNEVAGQVNESGAGSVSV